MSGAGVRLILRSLSGSVQLKNLRLKSLTTDDDKDYVWGKKAFSIIFFVQ